MIAAPSAKAGRSAKPNRVIRRQYYQISRRPDGYKRVRPPTCACKMGSYSSATGIANGLMRHTRARAETAPARPLLGLAQAFTLQATSLPPRWPTPTLSPLPRLLPVTAVCFLWHFPAHAGWTLSTALFPWSPDFPPAVTRQRLPSRLVSLSYTVLRLIKAAA